MKQYVIEDHAIDQAVERLGRKRGNARNDILQRLQTAVYQGKTSTARIFDHYASRTRFILNRDKDVVVTVYSMDTEKPSKWYDGERIQAEHIPEYKEDNVFLTAFQSTVKRELSKARRLYIREYRRLTEEIAVIGLDIAQLTLNKARARSPITQEHIQRKIDDLHAEAVRKDDAKGELEAQFRAMKTEVSGLIPN